MIWMILVPGLVGVALLGYGMVMDVLRHFGDKKCREATVHMLRPSRWEAGAWYCVVCNRWFDIEKEEVG
jgi:hypothetical protein